MKTILSIVILLLGVSMVNAQSLPKDVPTLEALIDGHKGKWKGLEQRRNLETTNIGINEQVARVEKEYKEIKEKTSERIKTSYDYLVFGSEIVQVTGLLSRAVPALKNWGTFALENSMKHPAILIYYNKSFDGIMAEINKCGQMITYNTIYKSTYKQKYDLLMELKASLEIIVWLSERCLFMSQGIVGLDLGYKRSFQELLNDAQFKAKMEKISQDIISKYSNKL